jgi:hypothetical protein
MKERRTWIHHQDEKLAAQRGDKSVCLMNRKKHEEKETKETNQRRNRRKTTEKIGNT